MAYGDTWNSNAQIDADSKYVAKNALEDLAGDLQVLNWSIVEHRQRAFDIIKTFINENARRIFAHDKEFPKYQTYLKLAGCDLPKTLAQLEEACSYKEASKHRNEPEKKPESSARIGKSQNYVVKNETGHAEGLIVSYSSDDDARVAFYEAIRTLLLIAETRSCLTTKEIIEAKHGLKWA